MALLGFEFLQQADGIDVGAVLGLLATLTQREVFFNGEVGRLEGGRLYSSSFAAAISCSVIPK